MDVPTRIATPGRASAISPVQWVRAFAYTPDSIPARSTSQHLDHAVDDPESAVDDALPTQFHPRAVGGAVHPRFDTVPMEGSDAYYVSDHALTVPAKCKRQSRSTDVSSSVSSADGLPANSQVSSQQCIGKTQFSTEDTSVTGANAHNSCPSLSNSSSRPRSRRLVLDAVEIVNKRGSQLGRRRTVRAGSTENTHRSASSHYPSPPVSLARKNTTVDDSASLVAHPLATFTEHVGPSRLKVSKYFTRISTSVTPHRLHNVPVLTPPTSPTSIIRAYIEPSDFGCPSPTVLLDELMGDVASDPTPVSSWENSSGLFDDLMIMLRRLKPILIQESVSGDPWKVLIAVRLLNVTTGKAAIPVFCKIISRWPTPQDLVRASQDELVELLRPLGLYNKRAQWLKDMSQRVLRDRQDPKLSGTAWDFLLSEADVASSAHHSRYPGVGPYAFDSLRIFCTYDKDTWMRVMPRDKELIRYLRWRWAFEKGKVWYPEGIGVIGDVNVPYLVTLVDELATHYDDAIGGEGYMYHFCNDLCDMLNGNTAQ